MLFFGNYKHTIDAKHRLAVPAPIRRKLEAAREAEARYLEVAVEDAGPIVLYATLGDVDQICLYTHENLMERARELQASDADDALLDFEEHFYGNMFELEVDKQGRIRLPEQLLDEVDLGDFENGKCEVILVGRGDHMGIVDPEVWKLRQAERKAKRQQQNYGNPRRQKQTASAPAPAPGSAPGSFASGPSDTKGGLEDGPDDRPRRNRPDMN